MSDEEGEVPTVSTTTRLVGPWPAHGLRTLSFSIDKLAPPDDPLAEDYRYENARMLIADWLNGCNELDQKAFAKPMFDIWIGQELKQGTYCSSMQLTFTSKLMLPEERFFSLLKQHPASTYGRERGQHPVRLGATPSVHVRCGRLTHQWSLSRAFMRAAGRYFRRYHDLSDSSNDPYLQSLSGVEKPIDFSWEHSETRSALNEPRYALFELIENAGKKSAMVTVPSWVVSISNAEDLDDQLKLGNIGLAKELPDAVSRLHYIRYVRPALRYYCAKLGRPMPDWLVNDSSITALSEEEKTRIFGQPTISVREFSAIRLPRGGRITSGNYPASTLKN